MRILTILAFMFLFGAEALPQTTSAQQRRDDLARVRELVNDPDPLQRIPNFEEIIAEGDTVKLQIAIRAALTSNDAMLRGLAFRAYMGGVRRFLADLALEASIQQRLDRAAAQGAQQLAVQRQQLAHVAELVDGTAMRADIEVREFDLRSGRGKLQFNWPYQQPVEFQINGDRLITQLAIANVGNCPLEMRPTSELQLEGYFVCQGTGFGRVHISAPMF